MTMHNPPHVGEVLREEFFNELNLSITQLANILEVSRPALSNLLNEKTGISYEMAIKLSQAFNTSAEFWINLQTQYELWHSKEKMKNIKIKSIA
ncbi:MAG: addiction module antidote protein, HigA family [Gammaproteobacteria bacterium]|nr:MAG: addiction module antidote protein, HigA family [Gammaproteobacteria bacterium]UTW43465.1 HigA family addiction module antidote protein [bacterium SCSIO 12844]